MANLGGPVVIHSRARSQLDGFFLGKLSQIVNTRPRVWDSNGSSFPIDLGITERGSPVGKPQKTVPLLSEAFLDVTGRPLSGGPPMCRLRDESIHWRATLVWTYPLVNVYITMERSTMLNGKTHYKWPFSIAMLNYQRVKTHVSQSFINVYDVQTNRCAHHKNLGIYLFSCLGTHHDKHESSIWSIKARRDIGTTLTPTIILM